MEKRIGNYLIKIELDNEPESPREWDNLGTMVCFHGRYSLGDKHDYKPEQFNGWDDMEKSLIKEHDICVILPLYLYDHSGITISTTSFSCQWDSGKVGFIYISKKKVRDEYSVKRKYMKQTEWDYQLCDDGGVSTAENVPVLIPIGGIFEHEYGKYKVTEHMKRENGIIEVFCDRL